MLLPNNCLWLLLCLGLACQPPAQQGAGDRAAPSQAPQHLPNGHYRWQSEPFTLEVSPAQGGRMVSLQWKGQELLTPRSLDTLAYGCSLWPSPMTWGWPPPPILDRDPHQATLRGDTLVMIGPESESFGWRMQRRILVWPDQARFICHYAIENRTDTLRRVAAWEVPRFHKGSEVFAQLDTTTMPFQRLRDIPWQIDEAGHIHIQVPADYQGKGQKVSYDGAEPWIGVQYGQTALLRQAAPLSASQFAPQAGELEVYVDDDTDYIEVEIQGPYQALAPGEAATLQVEWQLMDAPADPRGWWKLAEERAR